MRNRKKTNTTNVKPYGKILGEKIRLARKEQRISQKALANALHVSDKAISSYEVGRTEPSIQLLELLSKIVNKPLAYFSEEYTPQDELSEKIARIEKELKEVKEILQKSSTRS